MQIKRLNRGEAEVAMQNWLESYPKLPALDNDYKILRDALTRRFDAVLDEAKENGFSAQSYYVDAHFGLSMYICLKAQSWFTIRDASDDSFWRYLALKVIPDVVAVRWGKENEIRYWSQANRIWLKQIWWYIHLSWNTDEATTKQIVESPNCSTDTILNFVERTGRTGFNVYTYKNILYCYSIIPRNIVLEYNKKAKGTDLFRNVMKLNTARAMVTEPALCTGGCEGYAKKLFLDAGINIDEYLNNNTGD